MKLVSCLAILALITSPALAGDACPVPLKVYNVQSPNWLDYNILMDKISTHRTWIGVRWNFTDQGMMVRWVDPNSPAAVAGIDVGMTISHLNGQPVITEEGVSKQFEGLAYRDILTAQTTAGDSYKLTMQRRDPIASTFSERLRKIDDCVDVSYFNDQSNRLSDIQQGIFDNQNSFNCTNAHIRLQRLYEDEGYVGGEVFFVRGSRRSIITMPYWGTVCIMNDDLDSAETIEKLDFLVEAIQRGYVQWTLENP
jgi:hypothetical protein